MKFLPQEKLDLSIRSGIIPQSNRILCIEKYERQFIPLFSEILHLYSHNRNIREKFSGGRCLRDVGLVSPRIFRKQMRKSQWKIATQANFLRMKKIFSFSGNFDQKYQILWIWGSLFVFALFFILFIFSGSVTKFTSLSPCGHNCLNDSDVHIWYYVCGCVRNVEKGPKCIIKIDGNLKE